ncbi:MAG TPA: YlxR family protein [Clostridiales bacterium]|nr:YlxR family protein [Clostridiales bacterium]
MKVPIRTCVACRQPQPKKQLLRVVKTPQGEIKLDSTGRANGRGAYICNRAQCVQDAVKKKLFNRNFKMNIDDSVYTRLLEEYNEQKQN